MTDRECGRTVLVVEDDKDIRDTIAEILQDGDYHPFVAANGEAALAALRMADPKPCVILLDVMMPVMDGKTFRIEQRSDPALNDIPVVVLSAHADATSAAAEMKAEGFLRKPVDLDKLLDTIEKWCVAD
ncbi:MAG TPA: response regulator [Myxococcales bacterium]|jgi:CheY-like chemotaxis protein|nr:response regulator [Myxococcales bacterium]